MPRSMSVVRLLLAALPFFITPALLAEPRPVLTPQRDDGAVVIPPKFMRLIDGGATGGQFETATVTFKNKDGVKVRLVGAVHIADKSYYERLNRSFDNDDAVLFELVRPKDGGIPRPGQRSDNPISQVQHMMKDLLHLDFQLDDIDYAKPNFVHADMDAETFDKMQKDRGETFEMVLLKQLMKAFSPGDDSDSKKTEPDVDPQKFLSDLGDILTKPDMERRVKLVVARQLDKSDGTDMGLAQTGSVILTERNKVAMKKLKETIDDGKKNISVFYGAAHMPELSTQLTDMGFSPVSVEWNTAWDLTIRPSEPSAADKLLQEVFKLIDDAGK